MKPSALTKLFRPTETTEIARLPERPLSVVDAGTRPRRLRRPRLPGWFITWLPSILVIFLPTFVAAFYYVAIASDQYLSETRFIVKGTQSSTTNLLGQLMGSITQHTAPEELTNVVDYMASHEALQTLEQKINISDLYRRPEADWFARLKVAPKAEDFLEYYQSHVTAVIDTQTGLGVVKARAFRPEDAKLIADTLLGLGEDVINHFSDRQRTDTLKVARGEVERAEARVTAARDELTRFRDREAAIDPLRTTALTLDMIAKLDGQLAQARAELTEASTYLKPDNAKYVQLRNRVDALEKQVISEKKRLTTGNEAMAPTLAAYERLVLEREFADKGLASAMISMETARSDASKQHLYLVRIVQPNLPEKSLYPRRILILSSLFVSLCFTYGIGWLIIAGIREHAA